MGSDSFEKKVDILLVDDHESNLVALRATLSNPSYHLVSVDSGAAALAQASQRDFAVILLDVMMPEMDGFECARQIKLRRRSSTTPLIFLTAMAFDETYVFKGYEAGAVDYLMKPVAPKVVQAKVAFFVELFRATRALREQIEFMRSVYQSYEAEAAEGPWAPSVHADELRGFIARCELRLAALAPRENSFPLQDLESIDALQRATRTQGVKR